MKWDSIDANELTDDPWLCPWCRKALDPLAMLPNLAPDILIASAVARLRAEGRSMDEVVARLRDALERAEQ